MAVLVLVTLVVMVAPVALVALVAPEGGIAGQALEVLLRLTASLKSRLNHPHPVLLRGDGVVGGVRPERKLHPDTGPSLQDDKAAGRQALRPSGPQALPPTSSSSNFQTSEVFWGPVFWAILADLF